MADHHDRNVVPFAVDDAPVMPDVEAVRAITAAAEVIERLFVGGADWPHVLGSLRLIRVIIQKPPSICRRCLTPFRLEYGAAFALYRRGLRLPKVCAQCRAARRQERERAAVRTAVPPPPPENPR
jgi:hypothetical protein